MRSPVIAFGIFAAAAVSPTLVSAVPTSPQLGNGVTPPAVPNTAASPVGNPLHAPSLPHVPRELALDEVLISHRSVVQRHRRLEECILARAIIRSVKVAVVVGIVVTSQQSAYTLNTSSAVFRTMKDRGSDCSTVTSWPAVHWRRMETYCLIHAKG